LTLGRKRLSSEEISYSTGISEAEVITVLKSTKFPSKGPATVVSTVIEERRLDTRMIVQASEETRPYDANRRAERHGLMGTATKGSCWTTNLMDMAQCSSQVA
jgi:hypothetical protein